MVKLVKRKTSAKALVVDREPSVRSVVQSILSGLGFQVVDAGDGRHALSLVRAKPCLDLLVTDAQTPGVDGRMLAEAFMLQCPFGRAILLSGTDDSESVNSESTGAWVFLPRRHVADLLVDAIRGLGLAHPPRIVLVAEDDSLVRNLVERILIAAGHVVLAAGDGAEALQISRAYPAHIDLLISDVVMPRMNGMELAKHIMQQRPETRILLMSGYASGVLLDHLKKRDFVAKPFAPKKLIDKVNELLNRPAGPPEPEKF